MTSFPNEPEHTPGARAFPPVSSEGPTAAGPPGPTSTLWSPGPPPGQPPPRRSNRLRWIVALLATALVVTGGVALALVVGGSRTQTALGPTYLPAGSFAYLEARLDLPGDQRE